MDNFSQTQVYLVGAGPGDPDLITMKATRALAKADVVLYDFLVHPNLLHYCSAAATLICVGKRKGFHLKKQAQIHQLILKYVKQHKVVVRLKGGDPLVFGRGSEEMVFLSRHAIRYEVVPGISSAMAVPTYAGIPLTHRSLSRSVAFVTGSVSEGDSQDIQIPNADTLVFLMGVTALPHLVNQILKLKKFSLKTPAALIYRGTTADQQVVVGTLGDIVQKKEAQAVKPPALVVVGQVVGLQDTLAWRSFLPLSGKRIVLLRAQGQNTAWVQQLSDLGAEVVALPLIETKVISAAVNRISASFLMPFTTMIFTSPNGVTYFMESVLAKGLDARAFSHKKMVALGPKTAQTLKQYGIIADEIPTDYVAEGVLSLFSGSQSKERILLAIAKGAREVLAEGLKEKGARVTVLKLYETVFPKGAEFPIKEEDAVVFTSSSTATHFFTHPLYKGQKIKAYCLGPVTAQTVRQYAQDIWVSPEPTFESLVKGFLS